MFFLTLNEKFSSLDVLHELLHHLHFLFSILISDYGIVVGDCQYRHLKFAVPGGLALRNLEGN